MDIVSICGSLRNASNSRIIESVLQSLAPAGMRVISAPPIGEIPFYNHDVQVEQGFLAKAIRAADGVIIVSPEYNWSVPGALKNALDWVSRMQEQPLKNKPVALQSSSPGPLGASRMQYHLRQVLASMDALALTKPEIFVTFVGTKIDIERRELTDDATRDIIKQQLVAFGDFISYARPS
jgi:chromate reductase